MLKKSFSSSFRIDLISDDYITLESNNDSPFHDYIVENVDDLENSLKKDCKNITEITILRGSKEYSFYPIQNLKGDISKISFGNREINFNEFIKIGNCIQISDNFLNEMKKYDKQNISEIIKYIFEESLITCNKNNIIYTIMMMIHDTEIDNNELFQEYIALNSDELINILNKYQNIIQIEININQKKFYFDLHYISKKIIKFTFENEENKFELSFDEFYNFIKCIENIDIFLKHTNAIDIKNIYDITNTIINCS
jgi:hypothetical protein